MTTKEQCVNSSKPRKLKTIKNDSNTNVIKVWQGPKSPHTFRCSDELWKSFVSETKRQGDSVCHVMEAIIAGVLGVLKENVYNRNTITIENLNVERVLARPRRHRHFRYEYAHEPNFYDGDWKYVSDSVLNENGHAVGCVCKSCRGLSNG